MALITPPLLIRSSTVRGYIQTAPSRPVKQITPIQPSPMARAEDIPIDGFVSLARALAVQHGLRHDAGA